MVYLSFWFSIKGRNAYLDVPNPTIMKKFLYALTVFLAPVLFSQPLYAQVCNPSGNYMIFSNYDGGRLTINVDVNIPNLKIGVVSYEAVEITLTGTYASNVVAVDYSGFNASNNHCPPLISTTTVTGFASPTINVIPMATLSDPDGYPYIICAYNCAGSTGGCNTSEQVEHYYQTMFGGAMYAHYTQYGCWSSTSYNVSAGGTCCPVPTLPPVASFSLSSTGPYCVGDCISFTDMSINMPDTWTWTISGGTPGSSILQNPTACFLTPGNFNITLVAANAVGTDVMTQSITVSEVNTTTSVLGAIITAQASGATYQWIDCGTDLPIPGATLQSYTATNNGAYAAVVTEAGCSDTTACVNISTLGLGQLFTPQMVSIYPNPAGGSIVIEDKWSVLGQAKLSITNNQGQEVYVTTLNESRKTVDLSTQAPGIYFVNIKTIDGVLVKKLVLE